MKKKCISKACLKKLSFFIVIVCCSHFIKAQVNFSSLLHEMADRALLARFPSPAYQSLQASSYNRESVTKDSAGWFADSDGIGFIRKETVNGNEEWVVMEHNGPGAITRMWAPYFYYGGLDDLEGPVINIYLDGNTTPTISENYFKLITGKGSFPPPFAQRTARAGDSYMPVPFAKSCKVTFDKKPFYNIINYRAYSKDINVESFSLDKLRTSFAVMNETEAALHTIYHSNDAAIKVKTSGTILPGKTAQLEVFRMGAVRQLEIQCDPQQFKDHPELLRNLILTASFDGEECIWAPLGDFFGSANALHSFQTFTRTVNTLGQMVCTWQMPFKSSARVGIKNLGNTKFELLNFHVRVDNWKWDEQSMHFHTNWHSDELLPGNVFKDLNFIDIKGKGVVVGDALTVLNPDDGWWGEGDEKIYIDNDYNKQFPSHFGTGTEDYYGWAGGENPGKDDVFSHPFLSNIEVGSASATRQGAKGFNICTRVRSLDAIPFNNRLVFDMEASPGTQIRNAWNFLNYSSVVFWYALPGAVSNRMPEPAAAIKPMITLKQIDSLAAKVKGER